MCITSSTCLGIYGVGCNPSFALSIQWLREKCGFFPLEYNILSYLTFIFLLRRLMYAFYCNLITIRIFYLLFMIRTLYNKAR